MSRVTRPFPALGIGWLLAIVGLLIVIVLFVTDAALTPHLVEGLFALVFAALLL